jgi:2-dehydro-3-deoxyphosphooctonate aldolase (KDO 8-P synthase)
LQHVPEKYREEGRGFMKVGRYELGEARGPFFIAGPCVIEDTSATLRIAEMLSSFAGKLGAALIFKSSYRKANRTSIDSFTGPGLEEGLAVLERVRRDTGLPVTSDVHCRNEVRAAAEVLDLIQIPAFLSRQTELITAAAGTGKPLNIKKGQFMSPREAVLAAGKARSTGAGGVMLTERGTFFGYGDLVVDMRSMVDMRSAGFPVVFDATHSVQRPAGLGTSSGGDRRFIFPLMRCAAVLGADGIFFETHPDPERALSDGPVMLPLSDAARFMEEAIRISEAACERASREAERS